MVVLNSSSLRKIKSGEKILSELQNTCKNEKENEKQLPVRCRVKRLIASRRLNLILIKFSQAHTQSAEKFNSVKKTDLD